MSDPVIQVSNLSKYYKDVQAVKDLSFEVQAGEILGILGPNGSGKTTTLKSILGLIFFEAGQIRVQGLDVIKYHRKIMENVGTVLEGSRNVYWYLSPRENIEYFAGIRGLSKAQIRDRMEYLLETLDLAEVQNKEIRKLSKGFKQKAALACAFIHNPEILLLDEPNLGLDVEISNHLKHWLHTVSRKDRRTILVTSHDMRFIESICDRVLIIKEGTLIFLDTLRKLKQTYSKKVYELDIEGRLSERQKTLMNRLGDVQINMNGTNEHITVLVADDLKIYDFIEILKAEHTMILDIYILADDLERIFINLIH
jgi:ABC-2 type transport system ATP-binding protein